MTLRERLRQMASAMPPGSSVTLPRDWILQELDMPAGTDAGAVDLTVQAVAELFKKKPGTIRKWVASGEFPGAYQLHGKEWRIPPASLEAFKAHHRRGAGGESPLAAFARKRV